MGILLVGPESSWQQPVDDTIVMRAHSLSLARDKARRRTMPAYIMEDDDVLGTSEKDGVPVRVVSLAALHACAFCVDF